eukprot:1161565-Pelagomonas_calceolata.AAC.10
MPVHQHLQYRELGWAWTGLVCSACCGRQAGRQAGKACWLFQKGLAPTRMCSRLAKHVQQTRYPTLPTIVTGQALTKNRRQWHLCGGHHRARVSHRHGSTRHAAPRAQIRFGTLGQ